MKGSIGLKSLLTIVTSALLFTSCNYVPKKMTPELSYAVSDRHLKNLPSPFSPLTEEEKQTPWGIEYQIGKGFAKKLDLYRAITAFERSEILAPENHPRKLETDYQILLSYYLGKRYREIEKLMAESPLAQADATFPPFLDLLVILFDTKMHLDQEEKACQILELIGTRDEPTYRALLLGSHLREANLEKIREYGLSGLELYDEMKKSPKLAGILSAMLPGSGYFYVGQLQTAITGLLLNALFIFAIIAFFKRRLIALGILFLSFEIGWYGGGIYGASGQAVYYNQRVFEEVVTPIMNKNGYFPIHQLRYAF